MKINRRIRTLRAFLREEQLEFCLAVGLTQSQLSKIENEKQKGIEPEAILSIISKYNVNPNWLKGDIGDDDKPIFMEKSFNVDIEATIKERDEFRDKLLIAQEQLLEYKTLQIKSLKSVEDISK